MCVLRPRQFYFPNRLLGRAIYERSGIPADSDRSNLGNISKQKERVIMAVKIEQIAIEFVERRIRGDIPYPNHYEKCGWRKDLSAEYLCKDNSKFRKYKRKYES